jgi:hypothetical protein
VSIDAHEAAVSSLLDMLTDAASADEPLFPAVPPAMHVTTGPRLYGADCLGCTQTGQFVVGAPRLCKFCAEDTARTREHVAYLVDAVERRLVAAQNELAATEAEASPEVRAAFAQICRLLEQLPRSRAARVRLDVALKGVAQHPGIAALLQADRAVRHTSAELAAMEARYRAVVAAINQQGVALWH